MPSLLCDMHAGMYALHDNVVVCQPLIQRQILLPMVKSQPYHLDQLARVLAAYEAAAVHLRDRYVAVAHAVHHTAPGQSLVSPEQQRRLSGVPQMQHEAMLSASQVRQLGDIEATVGLVLPYPLVGNPQYSKLTLMAGSQMEDKLIFTASDNANSQRPVFIKFTSRTYPVQVGVGRGREWGRGEGGGGRRGEGRGGRGGRGGERGRGERGGGLEILREPDRMYPLTSWLACSFLTCCWPGQWLVAMSHCAASVCCERVPPLPSTSASTSPPCSPHMIRFTRLGSSSIWFRRSTPARICLVVGPWWSWSS